MKMATRALDAALAAADRLHADTSVSLSSTLAALHTLRDHVDVLMDAVRTDLDKNIAAEDANARQ